MVVFTSAVPGVNGRQREHLPDLPQETFAPLLKLQEAQLSQRGRAMLRVCQ